MAMATMVGSREEMSKAAMKKHHNQNAAKDCSMEGPTCWQHVVGVDTTANWEVQGKLEQNLRDHRMRFPTKLQNHHSGQNKQIWDLTQQSTQAMAHC